MAALESRPVTANEFFKLMTEVKRRQALANKEPVITSFSKLPGPGNVFKGTEERRGHASTYLMPGRVFMSD